MFIDEFPQNRLVIYCPFSLWNLPYGQQHYWRTSKTTISSNAVWYAHELAKQTFQLKIGERSLIDRLPTIHAPEMQGGQADIAHLRQHTWRLPPIVKKNRFRIKDYDIGYIPEQKQQKLECGPMLNVMAALWNIGGDLCWTPQSLADAFY